MKERGFGTIEGSMGLLRFGLGWSLLVQAVLLALAFEPRAQNTPSANNSSQSSATPQESVSEETGADSAPTSTRRGRRAARQAEGSQAPNKFEADPVVHSKYQLNGRPLEVDPD